MAVRFKRRVKDTINTFKSIRVPTLASPTPNADTITAMQERVATFEAQIAEMSTGLNDKNQLLMQAREAQERFAFQLDQDLAVRRAIARRTLPIKQTMAEVVPSIINTELEMALSMIDTLVGNNAFWNCKDPNEATFLDVFILPIVQASFGKLDLSYRRVEYLDVSPEYASEEFRPDIQFLSKKDGIPLVLLEAKKPLVSEHLLLRDERKLCSMMKLSLDRMAKRSEPVSDPQVIGVLA
ncbi:hypothetical protein B0O80DRAFT_496990 [Mortierella sp. GBAus27b]|nr:hypothetical protein B0O80DRAFT_496990 [Mortierella sp. GBAus27b]